MTKIIKKDGSHELFNEEKIIKAVKSNMSHNKCGVVICSDEKLVISCKDSSVEFVTVQPEGAKIMSAKVMLNGNKIPEGTVVE